MKKNFLLFSEKAMTILFSLLMVFSMSVLVSCSSDDDPDPEPPKPTVLVEGVNIVNVSSTTVYGANALKLTRTDNVTVKLKVLYNDKTTKDSTATRKYNSSFTITENTQVTYLEKDEVIDPLTFVVTSTSKTTDGDIINRIKGYQIKLGAKAILTVESVADSSYVTAHGKTLGITLDNEFLPKKVEALSDDAVSVGTEEKEGITYDKTKLSFKIIVEGDKEITFSHTFGFPQEPKGPEALVIESNKEFTGEYAAGTFDGAGAEYFNTVLKTVTVDGELGFNNLKFEASRIAQSNITTLSFNATTAKEFGLHGNTINKVSFKNSTLTASNIMRGEYGSVEFENSTLTHFVVDEVGKLTKLSITNTPTTDFKVQYTEGIGEIYLESKTHKGFVFSSGSSAKKIVINGAFLQDATITGEVDEIFIQGASNIVNLNVSGLKCKKITITDGSALQGCYQDGTAQITELTYDGNSVNPTFFFPIR